jgi:hypothetical protein
MSQCEQQIVEKGAAWHICAVSLMARYLLFQPAYGAGGRYHIISIVELVGGHGLVLTSCPSHGQGHSRIALEDAAVPRADRVDQQRE